MGIALTLHLLAATGWVGGLFFAFVCLRSAAAGLDAAHRLQMWADALGMFFRWVWVAVAMLLGTGLWMIFAVLGGMEGAGRPVHLMLGGGVLMMMLAAHTQFAPLKRLRRAVAGSHWAEAGRALHQVRIFVGVTLALGLVVLAIASGGRYFIR
jgi:uncharacterized membrane protein